MIQNSDDDPPVPLGRYADSMPRVHPVLGLAVEPVSGVSDAILVLQIGRFDVRQYEDRRASHRYALSREAAEVLVRELQHALDQR